MNVKQSYFDFLAEQEAKKKIQAIIRKGIDEWKQKQAYEYKPGTDPYTGDYSGEVWQIPGKTIGDIYKTDGEVLMAYSGNSEATFCSGHGLDFNNVAFEISDDINKVLWDLRFKWIMLHKQELFEEYDVKDYNDSWTEDDVYDCICEHMRFEERYDWTWMTETFPEYVLGDDGKPSGHISDLIFDITD